MQSELAAQVIQYHGPFKHKWNNTQTKARSQQRNASRVSYETLRKTQQVDQIGKEHQRFSQAESGKKELNPRQWQVEFRESS